MTLAIVYSRASLGMEAPLVTVEVHLSYGAVNINIVGLAAKAVKESKDRVRSAILNSHFDFPIQKVTINLAPADLPKEGSRFDLPIALGILAASGQIPTTLLNQYEFSGELALTGALRPIRGVLPALIKVCKAQRTYIIPKQNRFEAALHSQASALYASHLLEVCAHLVGEKKLLTCKAITPPLPQTKLLDLQDVKGQVHAKRALTIAAAGKHSMLFIGPPGTGKTMLAMRLPSILPPLTEQEALVTAAVASMSSVGFNSKHWQQIPFRAPHHTASSVALVGGGRPPRPGEISLAHHGVLFLDELPEFQRTVLEALREPLEAGVVTISRANYQAVFPAQFQLIAAMNPCPCGYAGSRVKACSCSQEKITRYRHKLSGPLLDRIDMHVEVAMLTSDVLATASTIPTISSAEVLAKVKAARHLQLQRQAKCNVLLLPQEIERFCPLSLEATQLIKQMTRKLNLSARSYYRLIKIARTIADLEAKEEISVEHVSETLHYRVLDK